MRQSDVSRELLSVCPSAEFEWQKHLKSWGTQERGAFNDVAVFARHVVNSYAIGKTGEFPALFELLEKLVEQGDQSIVELVTIGLLEDIQTVASNRDFGYDVFEPWLGPACAREWARLEATWNGKSSLADVIRDEPE